MKLIQHFPTETYVTAGGYYAVKQQNMLGEEQLILITPSQMKHIIRDMRETLSDKSWHQEFMADE